MPAEDRFWEVLGEPAPEGGDEFEGARTRFGVRPESAAEVLDAVVAVLGAARTLIGTIEGVLEEQSNRLRHEGWGTTGVEPVSTPAPRTARRRIDLD